MRPQPLPLQPPSRNHSIVPGSATNHVAKITKGRRPWRPFTCRDCPIANCSFDSAGSILGAYVTESSPELPNYSLTRQNVGTCWHLILDPDHAHYCEMYNIHRARVLDLGLPSS